MNLLLIFLIIVLISIGMIYFFRAKKFQKQNELLRLEKINLEKSIAQLSLTLSSVPDREKTEAEKRKVEDKNKKLWQMSETVYKEKARVDKENEDLLIAKEKLAGEKAKVDEKVKKLWSQSTAIHKEKERINELKLEIELKHKEIVDSVNYAERIQRSFLASKELLDENLEEYFVLFQPKDVVSGDFYWASAAKASNANNHRDLFYLVTADSTGHGVPGAIMSILNITCLEKAVDEQKLIEPSEILNHARINIIERLKKDGSVDGGKDGMDASLICFDFKNKKLTYAAANNPVWIIRDLPEGQNGKHILELAPDKMPVGKHDKDFITFTQHTIDLQKGDVVYTLTDGMPDQFGGPLGKKFMYKRLKELLLSIAHLSMQKQKETLQDSLNDWKGDLEQVDDVCIIGIRL